MIISLLAMVLVGEAVPANDPGQWITSEDYPKSEIARGINGVTAFSVSVSKEGLVTDCYVSQSSGSEALDATACALIRVRARFKPAKDAKGRRTEASYSSRVRWQLPQGASVKIPTHPEVMEIAVDVDGKGLVERCDVLTRPAGMSTTAPTPCINYQTGRQVRMLFGKNDKPQAYRMIMREIIEIEPR